jgi:hypothetical protein
MSRSLLQLLILGTFAECRLTIDDANHPEDPPGAGKTFRELQGTDSFSSDIKLETSADLIDQYYNIFKTGNRNAASHLWMSFVLNHSSSMKHSAVHNVMKGFCAISGSPVSNGDSTGRIYKVTLPSVLGGNVTGVVRHCCWPCVCDLTELVRVDTLTVKLADGTQQYQMMVIGDPCDSPDELAKSFTDPFDGQERSLAQAAPELHCVGAPGAKKLQGAIYSDHGFPIIGFLFTAEEELEKWVPANELYSDWNPAHVVSGSDPAWGWGTVCQERAAGGYASGMGLIFREVAVISPMPSKVDNSSKIRTEPFVGGLADGSDESSDETTAKSANSSTTTSIMSSAAKSGGSGLQNSGNVAISVAESSSNPTNASTTGSAAVDPIHASTALKKFPG